MNNLYNIYKKGRLVIHTSLSSCPNRQLLSQFALFSGSGLN